VQASLNSKLVRQHLPMDFANIGEEVNGRYYDS
jgi:hypothetical protein